MMDCERLSEPVRHLLLKPKIILAPMRASGVTSYTIPSEPVKDLTAKAAYKPEVQLLFLLLEPASQSTGKTRKVRFIS